MKLCSQKLCRGRRRWSWSLVHMFLFYLKLMFIACLKYYSHDDSHDRCLFKFNFILFYLTEYFVSSMIYLKLHDISPKMLQELNIWRTKSNMINSITAIFSLFLKILPFSPLPASFILQLYHFSLYKVWINDSQDFYTCIIESMKSSLL